MRSAQTIHCRRSHLKLTACAVPPFGLADTTPVSSLISARSGLTSTLFHCRGWMFWACDKFTHRNRMRSPRTRLDTKACNRMTHDGCSPSQFILPLLFLPSQFRFPLLPLPSQFVLLHLEHPFVVCVRRFRCWHCSARPGPRRLIRPGGLRWCRRRLGRTRWWAWWLFLDHRPLPRDLVRVLVPVTEG